MRALVIALLVAALAGAVPPQRSEPVIQQLLASGRDPDLRWPDLADVKAELTTLYSRRDWSPVWFRDDTLVSSARSLLRTLEEAPVRGLAAGDYDAPWLALQAARADTAMIARTDLAFSVAAARFALALRRGRVTPMSVDTSFHLAVDTFDLAGTVQELASSDEPNDVLRRLEPPFLHYWLLMASLVRYRQLSQEYALVTLPPMPRRLRPGEVYRGVGALRQLLWVLGDYRDSLPLPYLDSLYRGPVVAAVQRFQIRQGFTPDGVIGEQTRERLSHPFEQRIRQLELSLERWRWMPRRFESPPIIVNIPAFRLYAFRSTDLDERTMLTMNVVVGTAFKTQTPVFADELEYLIFAPYWDVTPSIALKEIKPEGLRDPQSLTRNRYELVENGEVVPPWPENIERIGAGVRVRQTPGPHNALGLVKFIMPNDFQIYLHDTPSKALFERTRRDASHGCIRLGDPLALAKFLLRDQPDWTDARIRTAMNAGEPTPVRFRAPVPIVLTYATALAQLDGEVYFFPDIYGHDKTLDQLLRKGYPYRR
jgi:L,D-transpeptidase YcbB